VCGRNQFVRINRPSEDSLSQLPSRTTKQSALLKKRRRVVDQPDALLCKTASQGMGKDFGRLHQNVVSVTLDLD